MTDREWAGERESEKMRANETSASCACMEVVIGKVWEGEEIKRKMKELACLCTCVCDSVFLCMCVRVLNEWQESKKGWRQKMKERKKQAHKCVCVGGRENETGRSKRVCVLVLVCDCGESITGREEAGGTIKKQSGRE